MPELCTNGHYSPRRANGNCIQCERERYQTSEKRKAWAKEYNRKKRERIKSDPALLAQHQQYEREYREKNKDRIAAQAAARAKRLSVEHRLQRKGIDPATHTDLVRSHEGLCDICGKPGDGRWKSLNVDHCHTTNEFRGMLCQGCNQGIGMFKDDPDLLRKAAEYIEKSRTKEIAA